MRIAINGWFLSSEYCGSGQYIQNLLKNISIIKTDIKFVLIIPKTIENEISKEYKNIVEEIIAVPIPKIRNFDKLYFEQIGFVRACNRAKADLIHVPYWGGPLISALPVITSVLDVISLIFPEYRGGILNRIYNNIIKVAARKSVAIISISNTSGKDIIKYMNVKQEKVITIYLSHNISPKFSSMYYPSKQQVRLKYNLPTKYMLYYGGFDVRKNISTLFQVYAHKNTIFDEFPLVIAGSPPKINSIKYPSPYKMIKELNLEKRVHFIGQFEESEKRPLLEMASAFVYLSYYEGFGLPPLEAMSCGTPVVASNNPAIAEIIGNGGIICDPDDVEDIRISLINILSDDDFARSLSLLGKKRASEFSWKQCALNTLDVYKRYYKYQNTVYMI